MLDFTKTGTYQDPTGFTWQFFGDNSNPNLFYVTPRPQWVAAADGKPPVQIIAYKTDGQSPGGSCTFSTELAVPPEVLDKITPLVASSFAGATQPTYQALQANQGAQAILTLPIDGQQKEYIATASSFGGNAASFVLNLSGPELTVLQAILGGNSDGLNIRYELTVPASLQAVTATLVFDSSIAYQYQLTSAKYNSWGDQVSPQTVTELLQQSGSSKVNLQWGIANPSEALRDAVSDWANTTLATLVTASVNQAIALQSVKSDNSFTMNQVSSFTTTYSENQVIAWPVKPQAQLSALGAQALAAATSEADFRKQVMNVSVALPFVGDSNTAHAPQIDGYTPVLIESVNVTVLYPGLSQAAASASFTNSQSATFVTPFVAEHGNTWDLEYQVVFHQNLTQNVRGKISDIDAGTFALQLAQAGVLTVTFDAATLYSNPKPEENPENVRVDLQFVSSDPSGQAFTQSLQLDAGKPSGNITSLLTVPINDPYQYVVTYNYPAKSYTGPVIRDQTGFTQQLVSVLTKQSTGVILAYQENPALPPILSADVKVWYQSPPAIPGMGGGIPSKNDPSVYSLQPNAASGGWIYSSQTFSALVMSRTPLVFSSSINALSGQIEVNEQLLENTIPSIMITPTQRYFTVTLSPAAIDWDSADFDQVQVEITATAIGEGASSPNLGVERLVYWLKGDNQPAYITYLLQVKDPYASQPAITYTWQATYLRAGSAPRRTPQTTATSAVLDIPPNAG